jgi:hypothetical protein
MCAVPVQRTRGFDARAGGGSRRPLRRLDEDVADAAAAAGLVNHESCDPAPRAIVVRHWHQEVCRSPDERPGVVGDEHVGSRIGEHAFEASVKVVDSLLVAQLVEQASELIGVFGSGRANGHCSHLGQSMKARLTMTSLFRLTSCDCLSPGFSPNRAYVVRSLWRVAFQREGDSLRQRGCLVGDLPSMDSL